MKYGQNPFSFYFCNAGVIAFLVVLVLLLNGTVLALKKNWYKKYSCSNLVVQQSEINNKVVRNSTNQLTTRLNGVFETRKF